MWSAGQAFAIVEQDIEIRRSTIRELTDCPEDWCSFPYNGPGYGAGGDALISVGLGCVRFSKTLLARHSGLPGRLSSIEDSKQFQRGHWKRLDVRVYGTLRDLGETQHVHSPAVLHHHHYRGLCACGTDHVEFPVDREGRYSPTP